MYGLDHRIIMRKAYHVSGSYSPALTVEVLVQSQSSSCIFVGERETHTQERILALLFPLRTSCLSSINLSVFGATAPSGPGSPHSRGF